MDSKWTRIAHVYAEVNGSQSLTKVLIPLAVAHLAVLETKYRIPNAVKERVKIDHCVMFPAHPFIALQITYFVAQNESQIPSEMVTNL